MKSLRVGCLFISLIVLFSYKLLADNQNKTSSDGEAIAIKNLTELEFPNTFSFKEDKKSIALVINDDPDGMLSVFRTENKNSRKMLANVAYLQKAYKDATLAHKNPDSNTTLQLNKLISTYAPTCAEKLFPESVQCASFTISRSYNLTIGTGYGDEGHYCETIQLSENHAEVRCDDEIEDDLP